MNEASSKLAKAVTEALNASPEVRRIIEGSENPEMAKKAMYNMLFSAALINDDKLREEVAGEVFEEVANRIK